MMHTIHLVMTVGAFICSLLSLVYYKRSAVYERVVYAIVMEKNPTLKKEYENSFKYVKQIGFPYNPMIYYIWSVMTLFTGGLWLVVFVFVIHFILYRKLVAPGYEKLNDPTFCWVDSSESYTFVMGIIKTVGVGYILYYL